MDYLTLTGSKTPIHTLPDTLGMCSGLCLLDDGNIFYCGGYSSDNLKVCYKINPTTLEWKKLQDLPKSVNSIVPLQIKDSIYVFGGHPHYESWRYSISDNVWNPISGLKSQCIYPVQCNKTILLAGM